MVRSRHRSMTGAQTMRCIACIDSAHLLSPTKKTSDRVVDAGSVCALFDERASGSNWWRCE